LANKSGNKFMSFYITKQYQRGSETTDELFLTIEAAKTAIQEKLLYDRQLRVSVVYRLYDDLDYLHGTFDINSIDENVSDSSDEPIAASGGAGQSSNFNPTPFNTAPRPAGIPHNWVKDEPEKKEDKEG